MGMDTNPGGNKPVRRTQKEQLKARMAAFSPAQNARVALAKQQASNGFKGESLNDHGLPDGHVQKDIDRPVYSGPKSRSTTQPLDKFADGSKSIKTKSKGGMSNFINGEADKVKNMSDADLKSATMRNMNFQTTKQNAVEKNLLDETVSRKYKKQGGYAEGTKSIKTKQYAAGAASIEVEDPKKKTRKSTINQDESANERSEPSRKFALSESNLNTSAVKAKEDQGLESAVKESNAVFNEQKTNMPTFTKSVAQVQDMDKVRQHQEKLNKYGAGLKVDGVWGAKTEAASRDLYPQYKEQTKTRQPVVSSSSAKEPVQAKPTGIKTASSPATTSRSTGPSVNGLGGAIQSNGDVTYSNGRMFNAATKRMENSVKPKIKTDAVLSRSQKYAQSDEWKAKSKTGVDVNEITGSNWSSAPKEIPSSKNSQYIVYTNGTVDDRKTGKRVGEVNKETGDIEAHTKDSEFDDSVQQSSANAMGGGAEGLSAINHMLTSKKVKVGNINDKTPAKELENTSEKSNNDTREMYSKGYGSSDGLIGTAETIVPALARKIKNPYKRAAVSVLPTLIDIAKTNYEDGFKTPIASTLKASARGAALGTIGSVTAGTVKRGAKGLGNTIKESEAMNMATDARAARAGAKTVRERNAAGVLMTNARAAVSEANKSKGVNPGIKESASQAFKGTVAGKIVDKAVNNPVVKGIRTLVKTKNNKVTADANKTSRAEKAATKEANRVETAENAKLANEGEAIANRAEANAQSKFDKANQEKYGYKPTAKEGSTLGVKSDDDAALNAELTRRARVRRDKTLAQPTAEIKAEASVKNGASIRTARREGRRGVQVETEGASSPNPNYKPGKAARAGIRTKAAAEAEANKKAPLLLDAQTPSTKKAKAVEKGIAEDAAGVYNTRRDKLLGERTEVTKSIQTRSKREKAQARAAKKKIEKQVEAIDAKQNRMFDYN